TRTVPSWSATTATPSLNTAAPSVEQAQQVLTLVNMLLLDVATVLVTPFLSTATRLEQELTDLLSASGIPKELLPRLFLVPTQRVMPKQLLTTLPQLPTTASRLPTSATSSACSAPTAITPAQATLTAVSTDPRITRHWLVTPTILPLPAAPSSTAWATPPRSCASCRASVT